MWLQLANHDPAINPISANHVFMPTTTILISVWVGGQLTLNSTACSFENQQMRRTKARLVMAELTFGINVFVVVTQSTGISASYVFHLQISP